MAEVPLTRGLVALVDDADLPLISGYSWQATPRNGGGWYASAYVRGSGRGGKRIYMHRLLLPDAPVVDHKHGNGLDNRRSTGDLRPCTQSQNLANMVKHRGTSRYKGVCWEGSRLRKWIAYIGVGAGRKYLGSFVDEHAAARAYNAAALERWGEFARLNVIDEAAR